MTKIVALLLLAVIAGALLWSAGEQHYRACVEARYYGGKPSGSKLTLGADPSPPPRSLGAVSTAGCSRSPF